MAGDYHITDEQGRTLILHGSNTDNNAKTHQGTPSILPEDVSRESNDWGFNFVRLLIFWEFIEPTKFIEPTSDNHKNDYLEQVAERVKWYQDPGTYVVLDMHQDLYGRKWSDCGGNGAPYWATLTDWPTECVPNASWYWTYATPGVIQAFDNFWDYEAHADLQVHYAKAWKKVAERFKDFPNVLGYDLMNEPFGGSSALAWPTFESEILTSSISVSLLKSDRWTRTNGFSLNLRRCWPIRVSLQA